MALQSLVGFNSRLVRLEVVWRKDTPSVLLASFNSRLVRLEESGPLMALQSLVGFNSRLVRLEVDTPCRRVALSIQETVSIPDWFD